MLYYKCVTPDAAMNGGLVTKSGDATETVDVIAID
jgi:hypothetical protein